tara:strand:+ start:13026 stop:13487 length:462 start_codon:yes stop_codon:yes gene_type:complete
MIDVKWGKRAWKTPNKIDISKDINAFAGMIKKDILEGITKRRSDIDGKTLKISPQAIEAKRKKGSPKPDVALYDTGLMSKLEPISGKNKATPQKQIATIKVSEKKTYKKSNLTAMDVGKKWVARGVKWFGVRKEMETQIERLMIKRIMQAFKR